MKSEDFNILVGKICDEIKGRLCKKAEEYSHKDERLHNFYKGASFRGKTPEEVLAGMKLKHQISIDDLVQRVDEVKDWDLWWEKIIDDINYNILLLGLIKDRLSKKSDFRLNIVNERRKTIEQAEKAGYLLKIKFTMP